MQIKNEKKNQLKKIIVTGANGFIGQNLIRNLIEKNYTVTILVRNKEKKNQINLLKNLDTVYFDIESPNQKLEIPIDSTLIHCAWGDLTNLLEMVHIEKHFLNNYIFLKNIIKMGIKNIIVTGTCYEYGLQYGPLSVKSTTKPNTPYGLAKDSLHKSLIMLKNEIDFNFIWARLFHTYGEGQNENNIVPLFDKALERNDKIFNMSPGDQLFDYLPVDTVADHLTNLINYQNGVINVCKGEPTSLRALLENRMKEKEKYIELNFGYYNYRKEHSLAMWGDESFENQLKKLN
jgi:dTDP-6-deoxy-L-talose 4-dehydrogenase (NAD+)